MPRLALTVAEANLRRGELAEAARVLELISGFESDREVAAMLAATRAYLALYDGRYAESRADFELAAATLRGAERSDALRLLRFLRDGSAAELRAVAAARRAQSDGRARDAFDALRDGLERAAPSAARPALLLWAGELALTAGALEAAEQALRDVWARYPESGEAPIAMMALAEALAGDGRTREAVALLEELIIEYPESALTPIGRRKLVELRDDVPRL